MSIAARPATELPPIRPTAAPAARPEPPASMLRMALRTGSLAVGGAAATISVVLGVTVGLVAGYRGGWVDSLLMRSVDILYGLPYILLVILFKIAFEGPLSRVMSDAA